MPESVAVELLQMVAALHENADAYGPYDALLEAHNAAEAVAVGEQALRLSYRESLGTKWWQLEEKR